MNVFLIMLTVTPFLAAWLVMDTLTEENKATFAPYDKGINSTIEREDWF
jgi:hypothetical protein